MLGIYRNTYKLTSKALLTAAHNAKYPVCPLTVHLLVFFSVQNEKFNTSKKNIQSMALGSSGLG